MFVAWSSAPRAGKAINTASNKAWLAKRSDGRQHDILAEGETPPDDPAAASALLGPWAKAGCTWWLETRWETPHNSPERMQQVHDRLTASPPRP